MKAVLIRSLSGLVYMALIILPVVLREPALFLAVFAVFIFEAGLHAAGLEIFAVGAA